MNVGPQEASFLTLNVGGPHLSGARWGTLPQDITASAPMIICLQEVRLCKGTSHMAYTARAGLNYFPLSFDDQSPVQMLLIHERLHKCCRLSDKATHAIALVLSLPRVPDFLVVNQHGAFRVASRTEFDTSFKSLAAPAV